MTTDEWGAVIPTVTVVFRGEGLRREVESNEGTGEFRIALHAGEHRVASESEGFNPFSRKRLRVEAGKIKRLRVKLKFRFPPFTE